MTDAARIHGSGYDDDAAPVRSRAGGPLLTPEDFDKILRLTPTWREGRAEPGRERPSILTSRDVAAALELVHEAAASIRAADERARDGDARVQIVIRRAAEEVKAAEDRARAAEARAQLAEIRTQEAEARAEEAENWLRQIFATISEELPRPREG
ncbi:hypothetical protein [Enterovirga rhinocerotis]|uniref:Uncharacterized protein n=1 Tax=Enterovirga rhinocerotis TaxID=1339210 RepID=A0A4R7BUY9_9HYPH|nr:hypothetical protein [Enterovirga rhinocerotis]TDR88007.1 hypothetical protein EV668_3872 [Enterovirga rhinocerotis]